MKTTEDANLLSVYAYWYSQKKNDDKDYTEAMKELDREFPGASSENEIRLEC